MNPSDTFNLERVWLRKQPTLVICKSPVHRWGVFSTELIKPYQILEESPYILVPIEEFESAPTCERYSYGFDDTHSILGLGFAGLYNHSSNPNAEYEIDKVNQVIRHYSITEIPEGQEITIDYGPDNVNYYNLKE